MIKVTFGLSKKFGYFYVFTKCVHFNFISEEIPKNFLLLCPVFCLFVSLRPKICVLLICVYSFVSSTELLPGWSLRVVFKWNKLNWIALNWKLLSALLIPGDSRRKMEPKSFRQIFFITVYKITAKFAWRNENILTQRVNMIAEPYTVRAEMSI